MESGINKLIEDWLDLGMRVAKLPEYHLEIKYTHGMYGEILHGRIKLPYTYNSVVNMQLVKATISSMTGDELLSLINAFEVRYVGDILQFEILTV